MDVIALGKLSLNLTGFTTESASVFGNQLNDTITKLCPFSKVIPLSVEYLNNAVLQPRKNNQSGRCSFISFADMFGFFLSIFLCLGFES